MWPFRPKSNKLFNRNFTFEPKQQHLSADDYSFQLSPSSKFPPHIRALLEDDDRDSADSSSESMEEKLETEPPFPSISPSAGLTRYDENESDEEDDDGCGSFICNDDTSEIVSSASSVFSNVIVDSSVPPTPPRLELPDFGSVNGDFLDMSEAEVEEERAITQTVLSECYGKSPMALQMAVQSLLGESPSNTESHTVVDLIRRGVWIEDEDEEDEEEEEGSITETARSIAPHPTHISLPPRSVTTSSWLMENSVPNTPDARTSLRISWLPKSYASSLSSGMDFFLLPDDSTSGDLFLSPEPSPLFPPSPSTPLSPFGAAKRFSGSSRTRKSSFGTGGNTRSMLERMDSLILRHYSIDMAAGIPRLASGNMSHEAYGELYWPENA